MDTTLPPRQDKSITATATNTTTTTTTTTTEKTILTTSSQKPPKLKIKRVRLKEAATSSVSAGSLASILEPVYDRDNPIAPQKKRPATVSSPLTGEKIAVPIEDIIRDDLRLKSGKSAQRIERKKRKSLDHESALTDKDVLYIPPVDREMPDVVFAAEDGKNYTAIGKQEYARHLQDKTQSNVEPVLESFTERFLRRRRSIFDFAMALYSGLCLCTLLVLPTSQYTLSPVIPKATCTTYPPGGTDILNYGTYPLPLLSCKVGGNGDAGALFSFLLYYSGKAAGLNFVCQVLASLVLVGSWERVVHVMESSRVQGGERVLQRIVAVVLVVCAAVTFAANVLMTYTDTNLTYSAAVYPSYAKYGERYWMFDGASLAQPYVLQDVSQWISCNVVRGIFGLIHFLVWVLMKSSSLSSLSDRGHGHGHVVVKHSSSTMRIQPVP